MHATRILIAEHEVILQVLTSLDRSLKRLERGGRLTRDFLEHVVTFAQNFADRFHHFKEEYLRFGLLAQKHPGRLDLHMGALRYGHDMCRGFIGQIADALDEYAEKDDIATLTVLSGIAAYTSVLRHHILTEDRIFFPMVETTLTDEEKEMLATQYHGGPFESDPGTFRRYRDLAREIASLAEAG